jgi:hypothetical protein
MNEPSWEFEERLRRFKPRGISSEMTDAVGRRLTPRPPARDWPMLCAIGTGLAAACVIVAMLVQQNPSPGSNVTAVRPLAAASPKDPPAVYAFNSLNNSLLDDSWRLR